MKQNFFTVLMTLGFIFLTTSPIAMATTTPAKAASIEGQYAGYPKLVGAAAHSALVKRGLYLTALGDCISCHTKSGGKPFAGGLEFDTAFGTIYSPNITPDKKNGIGSWTDAEFFKAMHKGISPKGSYYYPAFPYTYFNLIKQDDLKAIRAYLDAIPAVPQENQANKMHFPFNIRFIQLGWRILFFRDHGPLESKPLESPEWNRGAYIVEGLGHCGMCHTPQYYLLSQKLSLGAPIKKRNLAGSYVLGYYAPNINEANLKDVPFKTLEDLFLKQQMIGGGFIRGPMAEAIHFSLSHLTPYDVKSIITYLKTVKSRQHPLPVGASDLKIGKFIYQQNCAVCHTLGVGAAPVVGNKAQWARRLRNKNFEQLYLSVINGLGGMPPMGTCYHCSDDQIKDAVSYIVKRSKSGSKRYLGSDNDLFTQNKVLTMNDAKDIYENHCASCHNGSNPNAPKVGDKAVWASIIKQGVPKMLNNVFSSLHGTIVTKACSDCSGETVKAALIYMIDQSKTKGDYSLWLNPSSAIVSFVAASNLTKEQLMKQGEEVYNNNCALCHKYNGKGTPPQFPPLKEDLAVIGPMAGTIRIVVSGVPGTMMRGYKSQLTTTQLAAVITYIRNSWGNDNKDTEGQYAGGILQPAELEKMLSTTPAVQGSSPYKNKAK